MIVAPQHDATLSTVRPAAQLSPVAQTAVRYMDSVVRHCASLIDVQTFDALAQLEIECRARLHDASVFYALVETLAARATSAAAIESTDLLFTRAAPRGETPSRYTERICYMHVDGCDEPKSLYVLRKKRLLAEQIVIDGALIGPIRIDAQREFYRHPEAEWSEADNAALSKAYDRGNVWSRSKERRSFVLGSVAPAWRIDLTRVEEFSEPSADDARPNRIAYELEIELNHADLHRERAQPDALVRQFAYLLATLGLR